MGPEEFRRLAVSLPEAVEKEHMQHPDFRVGGKIFATIGYPDELFAMVKLDPVQQAQFVASHPQVFSPAKGAWGAKGATSVRLKAATKPVIQEALAAALAQHGTQEILRPVGTEVSCGLFQHPADDALQIGRLRNIQQEGMVSRGAALL